MPSNPERKLMTNLLKVEGFRVINYQIIDSIGIVLYLEHINKKATCTSCGALHY
jgi:hypothetical protein